MKSKRQAEIMRLIEQAGIETQEDILKGLRERGIH
ncbi:MAG TPA: arginine repressor, partial [Clostridiales bacterium]|nr:arginine repressor [Clostridiales bacterium]